MEGTGTGGNFHRTMGLRVGRRGEDSLSLYYSFENEKNVNKLWYHRVLFPCLRTQKTIYGILSFIFFFFHLVYLRNHTELHILFAAEKVHGHSVTKIHSPCTSTAP